MVAASVAVSAAVSPDITQSSPVGSVARKRRRLILQTQRDKAVDTPCPPDEVTSNPKQKKQKKGSATLSGTTVTASSPKGKKPQMRYEPDVPMTKEEAAVWRREQRRKRNRESAAASRQRQRDRISELEQEVDEWKSKYEQAMKRLEELEHGRCHTTADLVTSTSSCTGVEPTAVSPCTSPGFGPMSPPSDFPEDLGPASAGTDIVRAQLGTQGGRVEQHLTEKISRPA